MTSPEVQRRIAEYQEFAAHTLRPQIARLVQLKAEQQEQVAEYEELEQNVQLLREVSVPIAGGCCIEI
jgi:hypothetical protein